MQSKKQLAVSLLLTSLTTSLQAQTKCYSQAEVDKIAQAITNLQVCENELFLRRAFIEKTVTAQEPPHLAWFQEPQMIVGGLVISFSAGLLVMLASQK